MKALSIIAIVALASGVAGCYATTIRSGLTPESKPRIENDARWHHGLVLGIAELSGPYDLTQMCPKGWAEISTRTSFLNGIVDAITSGLYNPQTITVRCAAPASSAAR
jgi:hypothetical protein